MSCIRLVERHGREDGHHAGSDRPAVTESRCIGGSVGAIDKAWIDRGTTTI